MPRALLLTSTALRHQYFIHALCGALDVVGVWREEKSFKPEEAPGTPEERAEILKHFAMRDASEEKYFAAYKDRAVAKNILVHDLTPKGINELEEVSAMKELKPDVLLVFGTGILKGEIIHAFEGNIINLHLGLSPHYRGSGTNFWPLVNNEPEYVGATIHYLDAGIDSGAMICHARPNIDANDGPHDLGNKTIIAAVETIPSVVEAHAKGVIEAVPQRSDIGKLYLRKDFNGAAVHTLYENIENGMIPTYLKEKEVRDSTLRLLPVPCA